MSPPVSGRQWGKNPTWHDGILHGPAEFNLGCQRIVVQALKGRRNMCLGMQIVEDSKVCLSMVPKEPDSSLLMWNFYGLHSSHLPHFFLLWANQTTFTQQLLTRNSRLQHQCPEVQKKLFHEVSPLQPARLETQISRHPLFLPAANDTPGNETKAIQGTQLLCLSTGLLSLQWHLIWSRALLKKGNGQVLLLPNLRPYVVLITCGKVCLSHGEETCWSVATEEKGRCFNKLETPLS